MQNLMFVGKMCSGKTTCANIVSEVFGYTPIALADPIKHVVYGLNKGEDAEELLRKHIFSLVNLSVKQEDTFRRLAREVGDIPATGTKLRERLQFFGTDGGRQQVDDNIWIRCLLARITTDKPWAVDDVRFLNEYEQLRHKFKPVVLSVNPDIQHIRLTRLYGKYDPKVLEHASESDFDQIRTRAILGGDALHLDANLQLDLMRAALIDLLL